ncbi:MAG TPA: hypothetical protein VGD61_10785 [Pyrinomonadaceae bacterium]
MKRRRGRRRKLAAINDCTVQPLSTIYWFGGVGNSGMGKYHGEWGFRAYTRLIG